MSTSCCYAFTECWTIPAGCGTNVEHGPPLQSIAAASLPTRPAAGRRGIFGGYQIEQRGEKRQGTHCPHNIKLHMAGDSWEAKHAPGDTHARISRNLLLVDKTSRRASAARQVWHYDGLHASGLQVPYHHLVKLGLQQLDH